LTEEYKLKVFGSRLLGKIFGLRARYRGNGEEYIKGSLMRYREYSAYVETERCIYGFVGKS
jgi:hypothetical protein